MSEFQVAWPPCRWPCFGRLARAPRAGAVLLPTAPRRHEPAHRQEPHRCRLGSDLKPEFRYVQWFRRVEVRQQEETYGVLDVVPALGGLLICDDNDRHAEAAAGGIVARQGCAQVAPAEGAFPPKTVPSAMRVLAD